MCCDEAYEIGKIGRLIGLLYKMSHFIMEADTSQDLLQGPLASGRLREPMV